MPTTTHQSQKPSEKFRKAMRKLFAQFSVVSAILGGFAFTFVGALLGHPVTTLRREPAVLERPVLI